MTLVTIDITGVASSTGPDDRVVLRAPAIREKTGGGLVSTREEVVHLADGVGSINLDPGPVMVKFLCEGISDTGEKMGVVPDTGPVTLEDILRGVLTYTPAVVDRIVQIIQEQTGYLRWPKGRLNPATLPDLGDAPEGAGYISSVSDAQAYGMPDYLQGVSVVETYDVGNFRLQSASALIGGTARTAIRFKSGSSWTAWSRTDINGLKIPTELWHGATDIPADATLDSLPVGWHTVWGATKARDLGLPTDTQGVLHKVPFGNTQLFTWIGFLPTRFEVWRRRINTAGVDTGWVSDREDIPHPGVEVAPAGMKLVPLSLSLGQGSTAAAGGAMSGAFRVPIRYAAPITRWRLCFTNRNPRYGTVRNAQSVVSSIVVGAHADGAYSSAPTTVATNLAVSSNGAVSRTPWQTTPIGDGRDMAISYRYTTSGPEAPPLLVGGGWDLGTSSPGTLNPSKTRTIRLPFDMWIEAETYSTTPVVAGFGDSITCGVGATTPVFDSWPNAYARRVGALPMHYASSGDTFENWASNEDAYKITRWDHLARPDAVVWAMGTNDMTSTRTLAEHKTHTEKMAGIIQERWSKNLYATSIMPRNNEAPELKTVREQWNQWAATQPYFRDFFDFAGAIQEPTTGGILPAYNADGLHLSTAGSAAQAGAITRPVAFRAASKDELDVRVPLGAIPGQLLMATSTGARWSWADRHPATYHDQY